MFGILKYVFVLTLGVYLGFQLSLMSQRSACDAAGGAWTGQVCEMPAETG